MWKSKAYWTLLYAREKTGREWFKPGELFKMQNEASEKNASNPEFIRRECEVLGASGLTPEKWREIISDPSLYTFYSLGLPEQYEVVNRDMRKLCHEFGVFTPDIQMNQFLATMHNSQKRKHGFVKRRGERGSFEYSAKDGV